MCKIMNKYNLFDFLNNRNIYISIIISITLVKVEYFILVVRAILYFLRVTRLLAYIIILYSTIIERKGEGKIIKSKCREEYNSAC